MRVLPSCFCISVSEFVSHVFIFIWCSQRSGVGTMDLRLMNCFLKILEILIHYLVLMTRKWVLVCISTDKTQRSLDGFINEIVN